METEKAKKLAPMNKQVFYSKKGIVLGLITCGIFVYQLIEMTRAGHWIGIAIMFLVMVFVGSIWFGTKYILIDDRELKIQCGIIHIDTIDVMKITEVEEYWSLFNAPATSMDRIKISYGNDSVLISPPDKKVFVKTLLAINPKIKTEIA